MVEAGGTLYAAGWAVDPDEPGRSIDVHVYAEGATPGSWVFVGAVRAEQRIDGPADADLARAEGPRSAGPRRLDLAGAEDAHRHQRRAGAQRQPGGTGVALVQLPVAAAGALGVDAEQLTAVQHRGRRVERPGADGKPERRSYPSITVGLRKELGLFVNVRPVKNYPGVASRFDRVDLIIFRENSEDLYIGRERMVDEDTAEALKIISRGASERVARFACEYLRTLGRKHLTIVHKANVMRLTD